ncbi:hypothetical protein [Micromonospora arborensis]|uniref:hypothetical protein n=1 Tax=Micromonospora arborensis TaxID=2116518 RepID=UPI003714FB87
MFRNVSQHRIRSRAIVVGLAAILATMTTGLGTANASADSTGTRAFASQAASAGLTPAEARTLQAEVDDHLADLGGRQISANKIEITPGATILLPLPGEKQAREINAAAADTGCYEGHICSWQYSNHTGGKIDQWQCSDVRSIPSTWNTVGIFHNNQTGNAIARFQGPHHEVVRTHMAPGVDTINWWYIYYIDPC